MIRIPAWAQPRVRYEIAVVSKSSNKAAAQSMDQETALGEGPGGAPERSGSCPLPKPRRRRPALPGGARPRDGRRARLPAAARRRGLPAGAAGRAPLGAREQTRRVDALRVTAETNAIAMALILGFGTPAAYWICHAPRRASRRPRHARRAAARAPAGRRRDRPARRVRPRRAARRHDRARSGSTSRSRRWR